jgi:tRNA threonylcarbamoyladenosine biosynthesis protein TsaE
MVTNDLLTLEIASLENLPQVAEKLLGWGSDVPVWLFEGHMGAGKTTLIQAICKELQVHTPTSSPTFSIVNEYETIDGGLVYHFDFYRIKQEEEALDMGVEEYFDSGYFCFVEWPDQIPSLWPNEYITIQLANDGSGTRILVASKVDSTN